MDYTINLDGYTPSDIIDLHRQGLITLTEIEQSGCVYSEFNSDLAQYVYRVKVETMPATKVETI